MCGLKGTCQCGSRIDLVVTLEKEVTNDEINSALKHAPEGGFNDVL
jgi:glyceraldehyde-3-phosphate dehydrogenase/erythrose-4-phosphate dehydrogenase